MNKISLHPGEVLFCNQVNDSLTSWWGGDDIDNFLKLPIPDIMLKVTVLGFWI